RVMSGQISIVGFPCFILSQTYPETALRKTLSQLRGRGQSDAITLPSFNRWSPKSGGNHEAVAFAVFKDRKSAPRLLFRWTLEFDPARFQFGIGLLDIVTRVGQIHEGAYAALVRISREKNHPRFR